MRARRALLVVTVLSAAVMLAGCGGDSAAGPKPAAATTAATPTPAATTSEPANTAAPVPTFPALDGVSAGVPDGWKVSDYQGLTFALPPVVASTEPELLGEPDEWGLTGRIWHGEDMIASSVKKTADGSETALPYKFSVGASDDVDWDAEIRDDSDRQFSLTVPGAAIAAGSFTETDWSDLDAGKALEASIYLQGENGRYYTLGATVSVGEEDLVRQLAGTLKISD